VNTPITLADLDVQRLDPYAFMAVIGKRVIHPGGRRSTEEVFEDAAFEAGHHVLDVGCGTGTTAIVIARRFGCRVTAVDVDPLMLERAEVAVRRARVEKSVTVRRGDILALPFESGSFDRVLIEAVTMFVDRARAAAEVVRVCRPGGRVLDHEFIYRRPPTPEVRRIFEGEVCPGIRFDTAEDWLALYRATGLQNLRFRVGPFRMMTPAGMLEDEGLLNLLAMMGRVMARPAYMRKMLWLASRMARVAPSLGYVVLTGTKAEAA
jgi:SAM-dependent methyltransferase